MNAHPRLRLEPVAIYEQDPRLHTTVKRIVGYVAPCGCGWKSPRRSTGAQARSDHVEHEWRATV